MMLHVSTDSTNHGQLLLTYLEQVWKEEATSGSSWCLKHGIRANTVYRWKAMEPSMDMMKAVARGLGRSLLDVLIIAGYVSPEEANGHVPAPRPVSVEAAVNNDPRLSEAAKRSVLTVYGLGLSQDLTVVDARPKPRRSRKPKA